MTDLIALKAANAKRWADAKLLKPGTFTQVAKHLTDPGAKQRYQAVEAKTGVPWAVIAVIHEREASQKWDTHLGQGDPLGEVTRHVPVGEPAFKTWEEGALDALVRCPPYAAQNKDWSIGGALTLLEAYNGFGYFDGPVTKRNGVVIARYPSQASPYIWAGTDQYKSGKYPRDHEFDPNAVDTQLGCAGLLMAMMALDPTITFTGAVLTPITAGNTKPAPTDLHEKDNEPNRGPAPPVPSLGSAIASILSALLSIFKPKGK